MILHLKNMVCHRCKLAVQDVLVKAGLQPQRIELGEVEIAESTLGSQEESIIKAFEQLGFELLDDRKTQQIERIKQAIIKRVQYSEDRAPEKLSQYLSQQLLQDYSALSKLFSEVEGHTIEQYYILQKVEKVKELLVYNELTLTQIADRLHYSSPAYLSNQFKKITGLSPSHFKKLGQAKRRSLDAL